jgi:acetyltransferase-like isoleucine patch superfamily enzyme
MKILFKMIRAFRSWLLSLNVTQAKTILPIRLNDPFLSISIAKARNAQFILNGNLRIFSFANGKEPIFISLANNSKLTIDGDFEIGNGTEIILSEGAELYIGGKRKETASGITGRARIMVKRKLHIGFDSIIAWGVFITDCNWHEIDGQKNQSDTFIGDHVWLAPNSSVLKGSIIGNNSIVATQAVISGADIPEGSLICGSPAKIKKTGINWHRDMLS